MGRRLLILSGLALLLACPPARAQDAKDGETKDAASPAPAPGPGASGLPEISPADPAGLDPEPSPQAAPGRPAKDAPSEIDLPAPGKLPPAADEPPKQPEPRRGGERKGNRLVPKARDPHVEQAGAAGDPAAAPGGPAPPGNRPATTPPVAPLPSPAPSASTGAPGQEPAAEPGPGAGEGRPDGPGPGFVLRPDQLPLGKQEVALSVEVQAPPTMTFNRESTVKIVVRNSGSADALGVTVRDELPQGLEYVGSQPEAQPVLPLLTWRISTLPAGSERAILLKVKPTKAGGTMEHAATVTFQAGSKATTRVQRPQLKLEVVRSPSDGKVLKNKPAEFRITLANTGDGPARNVVVQAKLSGGLRHETGERNEENTFELPIQELAPNQREELDPLTVDAVQAGPQWCQVTATSSDVDFDKEAAQVRREVEVVEPKLKMTFTKAPEWRYTDTIAPYAIVLENPGTAPARNVKVTATLGVSGRLVTVPPDAKYDAASRRLQWTIAQIDPNARSKPLQFEVRMGGVNSAFEVNAEARGDNGLAVMDRRMTDVRGMADVELFVRERRRVVDVGETTTFQIRLRNYGTKEASRIQLSAKLSDNLVVDATAGGPDQKAQGSDDGHEVRWPVISQLGPGKEMILGIRVKVAKPGPKVGTCRVFLLHDDLTEKLEHMASVKITESHRAAVAGP